MIHPMKLPKMLFGLGTAMMIINSTAFAQDVSIDDVARNPVIANYKGYAEFKMAHYDVARQIWEALDRINYSEGAFNLGILAEDGLGEPRDPVRAIAMYERAAGLGSARATYRLGKLYWFGAPGILRDSDKGRKYLEMAAAGGDKEAANWLQAGAPGGALNDADMAESRGDYAAAAKALTAAAEVGDIIAQTRLAWYYEAGRGVPRSLEQAAYWFGRAANSNQGGSGEAMYALAVMHRTGAGMPQDTERSLDWLRRSAQAGYAAAIAELAAMEKPPSGTRY